MRGHFSRQNATQRHRNRQRQFLCCMTALVSLLLLPLTGCASQEVTRECFAMDTVMTLSAYGDPRRDGIGRCGERAVPA